MNRILLTAAALVLATSPVAGQARYSYTGATGPTHWGSLSPEYSACDTGHSQSPVNYPLPPLPVSTDSVAGTYRSTTGRMFNDGHTVQVNVDTGSFILIRGKRYDLVQFHFHYPAEHTVRNTPAGEVEVHLVHQDSVGRLAVLAIFLRDRGDTLRGRLFKPLLDSLPHQQGDTVGVTLNLPALFRLGNLRRQGIRQYNGSLTTPPCTEGVSWGDTHPSHRAHHVADRPDQGRLQYERPSGAAAGFPHRNPAPLATHPRLTLRPCGAPSASHASRWAAANVPAAPPRFRGVRVARPREGRDERRPKPRAPLVVPASSRP
ncbi:MAG: carbonic anhydrase, alpha family [Gemmatimonadetes bacterium]|nr:carbonic anhydrase, alpha family [Gemmatimonadota bacterium]